MGNVKKCHAHMSSFIFNAWFWKLYQDCVFDAGFKSDVLCGFLLSPVPRGEIVVVEQIWTVRHRPLLPDVSGGTDMSTAVRCFCLSGSQVV